MPYMLRSTGVLKKNCCSVDTSLHTPTSNSSKPLNFKFEGHSNFPHKTQHEVIGDIVVDTENKHHYKANIVPKR